MFRTSSDIQTSRLKTILVGTGWEVESKVQKESKTPPISQNLFEGDFELMGGNATKYNPDEPTSIYGSLAHVDVFDEPGFLTASDNQFDGGKFAFNVAKLTYQNNVDYTIEQVVPITDDKYSSKATFRVQGTLYNASNVPGYDPKSTHGDTLLG